MKRSADVIIDRVDHLHTFSSIIEEINVCIANDSASMKSIAAIIERDPSISAMVLRLANSSYYGLSQKVTTMSMALSVLGLKTLKSLINTASVLKIFSGARFRLINPVDLWLHSLGCAVCAKALLEGRSPKLQDEVFLAGLLHDIGTLVLLEYDEKEMVRVSSLIAGDKTVRQTEAEREILGFTHMEIGAKLANRWHFPQEIINVIRYHHTPGLRMKKTAMQEKEGEVNALLCASVSAGNEIVKALALGRSIDARVDEIDPDAWTMLGIPPDRIEDIMFSVRYLFDELRDSLEFPV